MRVPMIATKDLTYATRRLKAGDPFEASNTDSRILRAIGKADVVPPEEKAKADELQDLRAAYFAAAGEEPDKRWGAARLREGIEAAKKPKGYQTRVMRAED